MSNNKTCWLIYFFFVLLMTCSKEAPADNPGKRETDSLLALLPTLKDDTNKVRLYQKLIDSQFEHNIDSTLSLAFPALKLAEDLKWEKGINKLKTTIGRVYWKKGNYYEALKYHFETLKYYQSIHDTLKIAWTISFIGQDYADAGKFQEALNYFQQAKNLYEQTGDLQSVANTYLFLSFVYNSQGNYSESVNVNYKALKLFEQVGDTYGATVTKTNIAGDYSSLGNYQEALKLYLECLQTLEKNNDLINLTSTYVSIGNVYNSMGKYTEAVHYLNLAFRQATDIHDEYMKGYSKATLGNVYLAQGNYREALTHFLEGAASFRKVTANKDLADVLSKTGMCQTRLGNHAEARNCLEEAFALSIKLDSKVLLAAYFQGAELLDSATGDWHNAYIHHKKFSIIQDSINGVESTKKILKDQFQYDNEKKDVLARAAQEKKDIRQRTIRNSIAATLAGSLIFLVVVYRQRNRISKEKARSEELLLNILPAEVAEELKAKGSTDAKQFDEVTVMFTDFKGFTQISEKLTPAELVAEIHTCFKAFDNIITKYNIEKIKTIGDAYMCAGGLPVANTTNATDVVKAAIEIQTFMMEHLQQRKNENKEVFEIRIGIHTGPVVAGIVGVKKFAYDIWGDTVNVASRMESSGETGKVNISGSTYELVKDQFNCIHRGKIVAKNKGEIDMYFVNSNG